MEKEEINSQQQRSYPMERVMPSSGGSGAQEELGVQQNIQSMYCKDLVFAEGTEFSFEELRSRRYFKQLNEKVLHLSQMKQQLRAQIEQKQKLIQGKKGEAQKQSEVPQCSSKVSGVSCAPVIPVETAPLKIYSEPEMSSNSAMRTGLVSQDEVIGQGRSAIKQKSSRASKPFIVHEERPNTRSFSANQKSLKLPTSILKVRQPASESPSDKDASISRSEEAIINGHWNKTLCRSPDDTCDFVRAAQLASTPFGGPVKQNPSEEALMEECESLNKTASVIFKEPNPDAVAQTKKLSPIQEISHEWGYTSFPCTSTGEPESQDGPSAQPENTKVNQSISRTSESAPALESKTVNPCSLTVRKALLDNMDLSTFPNFSTKSGHLPTDNDDLNFDGETCFFIKIIDVERSLYCSSSGTVLVKVDESAVPWDFYICSQLRARLPANLQHCHAQSTCYFYENGSFTLWRIHRGQTIQCLLEEHIDKRDVPVVAVQLLEMVKQMHSCRLVCGTLRPDTLMLCSCEDSFVFGTDFSSSLDLELQPEVMMKDLPFAQDYIKQGLLLSTASPYQVDLCGIAEIVHLLLVGTSMKLVKDDLYWRLAEDSESNLGEPLGPLWEDFFHNILNPEDKSSVCVLTNLINNLKNACS
ncbi:mitotic checkpoint serine/threonine-protein kinase BUB1 beta [Hoplias malabaricus]|uniref:mitotic checkpoint serine/threonine-protein kinase BUB1 beta n=1 Tax=Hoplias malabaricus TaxID=27720 RepID=UPI0034626216